MSTQEELLEFMEEEKENKGAGWWLPSRNEELEDYHFLSENH